jgi:hypothetical protein
MDDGSKRQIIPPEQDDTQRYDEDDEGDSKRKRWNVSLLFPPR